MRIVVVGIGAVGGTIAAGLSLAGIEVVGIARGAQGAAIRAAGLRLRTPTGVRVADFACFEDPAQVRLRHDDLVVMTVKSQDSGPALAQLRAAGMADQPLFCAQNGVANEPLAARLFPNVHGITVMLPADYAQAGEVVAYGAPKLGIFDIGRWPGGNDAQDAAMVEALNAGPFAAFATPDVMASKYGKLLMNLQNVVDAAIGRGDFYAQVMPRIRAEAEAVLAAAGIVWRDVSGADPRRKTLMQIAPVEGATRVGSSTRQSLARGAGSVETDYLNGEIVMLGAQYGVATPMNAWFCQLAHRMVREQIAPGSVPAEDVRRALEI